MPTKRRVAQSHQSFIASLAEKPAILPEPPSQLGSIQVQVGKSVITVKPGRRQIELLTEPKAVLRRIYLRHKGDSNPQWVSVNA